MFAKQNLRACIRNHQKKYSSSDYQDMSFKASEQAWFNIFSRLSEASQAEAWNILSYQPLGFELSPEHLEQQLQQSFGVNIYHVVNYKIDRGDFHTKEGLTDSQSVDWDWVLLPCLAVLGQGYRLGQGGGWYDHWIMQQASPVQTIGFVLDDHRLSNVEHLVEAHDSGLSYSVSPSLCLKHH